MLKTRIRRRSQRTRAAGVRMLSTTKGQKRSDRKRMIAAMRRERTTRLEGFISLRSLGCTTVCYDGFQALHRHLLIGSVGLPLAIADRVEKAGQLMQRFAGD